MPTRQLASPKRTPGRPHGKRKRATREAADRIVRRIEEEGGDTPLDVITRNMRYYRAIAEEELAIAESIVLEGLSKKAKEKAAFQKLMHMKESLRFRALGQGAAIDAAPYVHARIQSVTLNNKDKKPFVIKFIGADARV